MTTVRIGPKEGSTRQAVFVPKNTDGTLPASATLWVGTPFTWVRNGRIDGEPAWTQIDRNDFPLGQVPDSWLRDVFSDLSPLA